MLKIFFSNEKVKFWALVYHSGIFFYIRVDFWWDRMLCNILDRANIFAEYVILKGKSHTYVVGSRWKPLLHQADFPVEQNRWAIEKFPARRNIWDGWDLSQPIFARKVGSVKTVFIEKLCQSVHCGSFPILWHCIPTKF